MKYIIFLMGIVTICLSIYAATHQAELFSTPMWPQGTFFTALRTFGAVVVCVGGIIQCKASKYFISGIPNLN
jgi:hypothetical protein